MLLMVLQRIVCDYCGVVSGAKTNIVTRHHSVKLSQLHVITCKLHKDTLLQNEYL